MNILVIEDNADIAANIGDYLVDQDHQVAFAADGPKGLEMASKGEYDVIVLDLSLPGMDGLELCNKLRHEARRATPVLMLTARDSLDNKLAGFQSGADDYMVKPFALQELDARIRVLSQRARGPQHRVLTVGELSYNLETLVVMRGTQSITLNPIGLKLLRRLMEASPSVVSREDLEHYVWGDELPDSDSLRVHVHSLRGAIDKPFPTPMIHTRHGIGYRLVPSDAA
jgi:DNA-binding response OmpR family regulator